MRLLSAIKIGPTENPTFNVDVPGAVQVGAGKTGFDTLSNIISVGIQLATTIAILFALLSVVWGAMQWITSEGDKQKVHNARSRIIFSIVGLALIFLSFLIIRVVSFFFGIELLGGPN